MATISEALDAALNHHQAGRLQLASEIYHQILGADPSNFDALHLLGIVATQIGEQQQAVDLFQRALSIQPQMAEAHNNLGVALKEQGKHEQAVVSCRQALKLKPDYPEAHNNLGNALEQLGQTQQAIGSYRQALALNPHYPEAHYNLANALQELGQLEPAVACYTRAIELRPNYLEALSNLGSALQQQGQNASAETCYLRALEIQPDFAELHVNLGNALFAQGKVEQAVERYQLALEIKPDHEDAHCNLAAAYENQKKLDAAVQCYREVLAVNPDHPGALVGLTHQLQHLCQWEDLPELATRVIEVLDQKTDWAPHQAVSPFSFLALPTATTLQQQLRCAQTWAQSLFPQSSDETRSQQTQSRQTPARVTIGYLSADFHEHATAWLTAELFEQHDRDRFRIYGYSYGRDDGSPMRARLEDAFDRFADVRSASFTETAQRIKSDGVDILIDLKGYTQHARTGILALRPATIQVNYLGYPGTMGAEFMDYILVDEFVAPPEHQPFYTERLVHLPGCYQVNDRQREISSKTPSRSECGLPEKGFVFCCFNNNYKLTPDVFDVWMRLLKAVDGSVLWLLQSNQWLTQNLRDEAKKRGVSTQRLVFAPRMPLSAHLARHQLADLFLDTRYYNAHTTASDSLWVGCPLVTMAGDTFASRVAGSLLCALGLPELVTSTMADYEQLALHLARHPNELSALRTRLADNRNRFELFDGERFARKVEQAYQQMWETHLSGQPPQSFHVDTC